MYAMISAISADFRPIPLPLRAFWIQALTNFSRSFLSAAFSNPFPSGWHELHETPAVPPPNLGSLKRAFPFSTSPAAMAKEKMRPEENMKNMVIFKPFVLFHLLSPSILLPLLPFLKGSSLYQNFSFSKLFFQRHTAAIKIIIFFLNFLSAGMMS